MTGEFESTVRDAGEVAVVRRIRSLLSGGEGLVIGPGDDCAAIARDDTWLGLLKTDCVIEGVHFAPGTEPERVGRKAMARALSDIAAMGGLPEHALITLATGPKRFVSEIEGWYRGMVDMAARFGCTIAGGETSTLPGPGALIAVSLTGRVERDRCLRRGTARLGDRIAVTGRLGNSFESGRHLDFVPRIPQARWLAEREPGQRPTSMMDLSDGLGQDLPRLLEGVGGYELDLASMPCHDGLPPEKAIRDGEDYELLLTVPPQGADRLFADWAGAFPDIPLTGVGWVVAQTERPLEGGWEHFRSSGT